MIETGLNSIPNIQHIAVLGCVTFVKQINRFLPPSGWQCDDVTWRGADDKEEWLHIGISYHMGKHEKQQDDNVAMICNDDGTGIAFVLFTRVPERGFPMWHIGLAIDHWP